MRKVLISEEIDNSILIPYYQIDCLLKNSNHHILPMSISIKDSKTIIETDISGMLPLSQFIADKKMSRKTAIEIILSYANCLKWCVDHFLDPHSLKFCLSDFYILEGTADVCIKDIYFRYLPIVNAVCVSDPIEPFLKGLFKLLCMRINDFFTEQEIEILSVWNLSNLAEGIELIEIFPEIIDVNSIVSPLHNYVMPKSLEERLNSGRVNNNRLSENSKHNRIGDSFLSKLQFTPFVIVSTLLIEFSLILLSFVILRNQNMFTNRLLPVFAVVLILIFCALADIILLFNPKSPIRILTDSKPYPIDPQDCDLFSVTEEKTTLLQRNVDKSRIAMLCNGIPGTPQETLGQKAYILVDDFLIGRDGVKVDFKINSLSVGRMHARITRRENSFFIEDLDTRNGTYIDDLKIKKKQDYLLPEKCKIRFADQVFYFVAT